MFQTLPIRFIDTSQQTLSRTSVRSPRIAVLIPCCNEELAVCGVIEGFHRSLPDAIVNVYDNNSSDRTSLVAKAAGAVVRNPRFATGCLQP